MHITSNATRMSEEVPYRTVPLASSRPSRPGPAAAETAAAGAAAAETAAAGAAAAGAPAAGAAAAGAAARPYPCFYHSSPSCFLHAKVVALAPYHVVL